MEEIEELLWEERKVCVVEEGGDTFYGAPLGKVRIREVITGKLNLAQH